MTPPRNTPSNSLMVRTWSFGRTIAKSRRSGIRTSKGASWRPFSFHSLHFGPGLFGYSGRREMKDNSSGNGDPNSQDCAPQPIGKNAERKDRQTRRERDFGKD